MDKDAPRIADSSGSLGQPAPASLLRNALSYLAGHDANDFPIAWSQLLTGVARHRSADAPAAPPRQHRLRPRLSARFKLPRKAAPPARHWLAFGQPRRLLPQLMIKPVRERVEELGIESPGGIGVLAQPSSS